MAAGAAVRVAPPPPPPSMEVWGRRRMATGTCAARRGAAVAVRCSSSFVLVGEAGVGAAAAGPAEEHYRTLRLRPGSTRAEVKKAFRRLALVYHPDARKDDSDRDTGVEFQKINIAYHILMNNMREAEEQLEYWRHKYGLNDQDLDRYRYYLNEDDDDWLDM